VSRDLDFVAGFKNARIHFNNKQTKIDRGGSGMKTMHSKIKGLTLCAAAFAVSTAAQTTVTNSNNGATNTVPLYTGSATLGNSPISVSGSNVGIETTNPGAYQLDVNGRAQAQSINVSSGDPATDLVNNAPWYGIGQSSIILFPQTTYTTTQVAGYFGLNFQTASGQMVMSSNGNVGIGTTSPVTTLEVNGGLQVDGSVTLSGSGASIISPALTGTPTAPTQGTCAANTDIATGAYVAACAPGSGSLPHAASNQQQFLSVDTTGVAHAVPTTSMEFNAVVNGGIDNTGATDMSTAIAALINGPDGQCAAASPVPIYFPPGTYKIDSGVQINATSTSCYGLHIRGAGPALTIFETNCSENTYGIWYDNTTNSGDSVNKGIIFEDFSVVSTDTTGLCNSLLRLTQKTLFVINRVHAEGAVGKTYATGTIGISGATVTGSGTTFTAAMAPGVIQVAGVYAEVCSYTSATQVNLCDTAFPAGTVSPGTSFALAYNGVGLMLDPGYSYVQYGSIHDYSSYGNLFGVYSVGTPSSGGSSRFTFDGQDSFIDGSGAAGRTTNSVGFWLGKHSDTFTIDTAVNNVSRCWVIDSGHVNKIGGKCENNSTYTPVSTCGGGVGSQGCLLGAELSEDATSTGYGNVFLAPYVYLTGTAFAVDNEAFNLQILGFQADDSFSNTNAYSFAGVTGCPSNNSGVAATIATYDCFYKQTNQNQQFTVVAQTFSTGACISVSTLTFAGVDNKSGFNITPTTDITGVSGWGPTGGGSLQFFPVPTANTFNAKLCNMGPVSVTTASSVTFNVSAR
jgi:hypothetical protein